jgi:hypothetical protein
MADTTIENLLAEASEPEPKRDKRARKFDPENAEPKSLTTAEARLPTYKEVTRIIQQAIIDLYRERGGKGTMGEYAVVRMGLRFGVVASPHFWKRFRSELGSGK